METNPWYDYAEVKNWNNIIEGGPCLFPLSELYIPINKSGVHWLLLQDRPPGQGGIELWDSTGCDLWWDKPTLSADGTMLPLWWGKPRRAKWLHNTWRLEPRMALFWWIKQLITSEERPNCRIFILVLLALLSHSTQLQADAYSQDLVYLRQIHKRIIHLI